MRIHSIPISAIVALFTSLPAFAQGADSCASAQPIVGTGTFAFDNTAATTDGAPDQACNYFNQNQIDNDVWFSWIATASGGFTISTCTLTTVDTKIAVYDGACGGPVLECMDDSCGTLQTSLDFVATAGNVYVIRLGTYPGQGTGTGSFTLQPVLLLATLDTQVNPANGHTYHLLRVGTWIAAEQTAIALGGHLATIDDGAENAWVQTTWQMYQGAPHDLWIGLNDRVAEGTFAWADGTPVAYTNWDAGEPNNGLSGEDYAEIRRDSAMGRWNDLANAPVGFFASIYGVVEVSTTPGTAVCLGDGTGTQCPCGNNSPVGNNEGCLSSLGIGGRLSGAGVADVSNDSLVITGSNMPNATCLYFQGTTALNGGLGLAFGDGLRCAGGTIIRLGTKTNTAGTSQYPAAGDPSISVKGLIPPAGGFRVYQCWYRNAAAFCTASTFNLTNGLSLTWQP
jgi:hypothetical protein